MDPYILLSARILHEERVASSIRRSRLLRSGRVVVEHESGWRRLFAWLLSFVRPHSRSLEKRTA